MTYPPQPPGGPYGPQQPDPYGQQPGPYGGQPGPYGQPQPDFFTPQQPTYQGLGGYPGGPPGPPPPPKKSNTNVIIVVVIVAVLVLGGAGTAIYLLTKNKNDSASPSTGTSTSTGSNPTDDSTRTTSTSKESGGTDSPAAVQRAYIDAYESKKFGSVVENACKAYKDKFGTDTSDLETQLAPYDIKATADGEPEVSGTTATALIDLELTKGSETKKPKIKIKIVKESGSWKFCGESEA